MDVLPSLQTLSSVAIWSNWRRILAYFPPAERFLNDLNAETLIQQVLGTRLGLGVVLLVLASISAHFAHAGWRWVRNKTLIHCYTKISIEQGSMVHSQVIDWTLRHRDMFTSVNTGRSVMRYSEVRFDVPDAAREIDITRMMNEIPPQFQPEVDQIKFWRNGSFFWLRERKEKKLQWHGKEAPDNWLDIYCFNWKRSTEPVRQLLTEILKEDAAQHCTKTPIYAPQIPWHLLGSDNHGHAKFRWQLLRSRLRRPLNTVVLDQRQKETIISDIRSFLCVSGVRWYEEKGLPLRLGYLFSGPPGTGKSSLAFAIASAFGLHVYMLNLSSPGLSDADVEHLFSSLPRFCVVLLEDVDATKPLKRELEGNKKDKSDDEDEDDDESSSSSDSDSDKVISSGAKKAKAKAANTVTLSGLLNAIDGVAASEGRILIMTTNHIENLDEALIRTGRADRIVTFTNTTKQQAADMFINAYSGTRWTGVKGPRPFGEAEAQEKNRLASREDLPLEEKQKQQGGEKGEKRAVGNEIQQTEDEVEDWTDEDILVLAQQFADIIRDTEFSPALLQQYFKDFRAEPRRAVKELVVWMEDPRGYRKPEVGCESVMLVKRNKVKMEKEEKKKKKVKSTKGEKGAKEKKGKVGKGEKGEKEKGAGEQKDSEDGEKKKVKVNGDGEDLAGDADDDLVKTNKKSGEKKTKRLKKLKAKEAPELSASPVITPPTTP